jgi:hypothetical protein
MIANQEILMEDEGNKEENEYQEIVNISESDSDEDSDSDSDDDNE